MIYNILYNYKLSLALIICPHFDNLTLTPWFSIYKFKFHYIYSIFNLTLFSRFPIYVIMSIILIKLFKGFLRIVLLNH